MDSYSMALVKYVKPQISLPREFPLLSLPAELRLMVYEEIVGSIVKKGIYDELYENYHEFTNILRTCKQIHDEVTPIIYRRITIWRPSAGWAEFFDQIGPGNVALIRDLRIRYDCAETECHGDNISAHRHWHDVAEGINAYNLSPKDISVWGGPCDGFWPRFNGRSYDYTVTRTGERVDGYEYTSCNVYKDLWFLKNVSSSFAKADTIRFRGRVNPLWSLYFRQRFGFIIKRKYIVYERGAPVENTFLETTLINPRVFEPAVDLKGYTECPSLSGVYERYQEADHVGWW